MNINELKEHCEKMIKRNNKLFVKEHQLTLSIINKNEKLIKTIKEILDDNCGSCESICCNCRELYENKIKE